DGFARQRLPRPEALCQGVHRPLLSFEFLANRPSSGRGLGVVPRATVPLRECPPHPPEDGPTFRWMGGEGGRPVVVPHLGLPAGLGRVNIAPPPGRLPAPNVRRDACGIYVFSHDFLANCASPQQPPPRPSPPK